MLGGQQRLGSRPTHGRSQCPARGLRRVLVAARLDQRQEQQAASQPVPIQEDPEAKFRRYGKYFGSNFKLSLVRDRAGRPTAAEVQQVEGGMRAHARALHLRKLSALG
jgi:hypothetical protein